MVVSIVLDQVDPNIKEKGRKQESKKSKNKVFNPADKKKRKSKNTEESNPENKTAKNRRRLYNSSIGTHRNPQILRTHKRTSRHNLTEQDRV